MIHDYWMHRSDDAFVRSFLPGIRTVLSWFTEKIDPHTGLLKNGLPHWNFTDWATSWERGIAPESDSSGSAITTLQLAAALDDAADLMRRYDRPAEAKEYAAISAGLKKNVYEKCWDASKGLLRDYIGSPTYSQHVNIMGILTDAIPHKDQRAVFERIDSDPSLTQTTFYYKFYLIRALKKVGLADRYTEMLGPWQQMIDIGLTTFAETPEPTPFGLPCLEFEPELRPAGNGLRRRTRFAGIRYGADRPASGTPETNQRRRTASAGRHHGRTATRRGYIIRTSRSAGAIDRRFRLERQNRQTASGRQSDPVLTTNDICRKQRRERKIFPLPAFYHLRKQSVLSARYEVTDQKPRPVGLDDPRVQRIDQVTVHPVGIIDRPVVITAAGHPVPHRIVPDQRFPGQLIFDPERRLAGIAFIQQLISYRTDFLPENRQSLPPHPLCSN